MGLLLGASALTVVELLDLIFYNGIRKLYTQRPSKDNKDVEENAKDPDYLDDQNMRNGYSDKVNIALTKR